MPNPLIQMEYIANVVIKAEPLATGLASDVHGQVQNHGFFFFVCFMQSHSSKLSQPKSTSQRHDYVSRSTTNISS